MFRPATPYRCPECGERITTDCKRKSAHEEGQYQELDHSEYCSWYEGETENETETD